MIRPGLTMAALFVPLLTMLAAGVTLRNAAPATELNGIARTSDGRSARVTVTARHVRHPVSVSVSAAADGRYRIALPLPGVYMVSAQADGYADARRDNVRVPGVPLALELRPGATPYASSAWLALLPDGEEKRRFVLDCTGCHLFDAEMARPGGVPRTEAQWAGAVQRMLGFSGAASGFPVISSYRHPQRTAAWIAPHVRTAPQGTEPRTVAAGSAQFGRAVITEYDMPLRSDLPHDVAVDSAGRVLITGMFSHAMYILDADSAAFVPVSIPVPQSNPRAVEVDVNGDWWVALGNPRMLARHTPAARAWKTWEIGVYPHSLAPDQKGGAWFNGHFTRAPARIGRADADGSVHTLDIPPHPTLRDDPGGPIPYELRTSADGSVWGSELQGNRVFRFTPARATFEVWTLPTSYSGPRRLDIDASGSVWIPAYSANRLVRLDPATGAFQEYPLPIPDAVPYVVRAGPDGRIWIGTAAADAVLSFDPATARFTIYALPSRGALIRHMAIDTKRRGVWLAYGASPGTLPARIALLQPE